MEAVKRCLSKRSRIRYAKVSPQHVAHRRGKR